jgi:two-component system sensor histidine kinase KdpD
MAERMNGDARVAAPSQRGRHRIVLGYAAGVGKTYAMLAEARDRISRGQDVVIGLIEPHVRADTAALATGIEVMPTRRIEYHGGVFEELDAEAVIARAPEWVLVDELAHTNVLGSGHEKRWESVEEILDNGIGVISTVNVQHVESLNNAVFGITGVRVTETVPDRVIEQADGIVLVDPSPGELLKRLKAGVVVQPDEVGEALTHFFRRPILVALRETARAIAARARDRGRTCGPGSPEEVRCR